MTGYTWVKANVTAIWHKAHITYTDSADTLCGIRGLQVIAFAWPIPQAQAPGDRLICCPMCRRVPE